MTAIPILQNCLPHFICPYQTFGETFRYSIFIGGSATKSRCVRVTAEKAEGAILVTTGNFTRDATAFVGRKPLTLIEGARLKVLIERCSRDGEKGHLLDVASWSEDLVREATIVIPLCPRCRFTMVLRTARQSGSKFWGCSMYPGCRGKRNVRAELMRA